MPFHPLLHFILYHCNKQFLKLILILILSQTALLTSSTHASPNLQITPNPIQHLSISEKGKLPNNLQVKLQHLFQVPSSKLTSALGSFTYQELEQLWQAYKISQPLNNRRWFRVIEEFEQRKAEIKVNRQLLFLYLAILGILSIFTIFAFLTYRQQNKITTLLEKESSQE